MSAPLNPATEHYGPALAGDAAVWDVIEPGHVYELRNVDGPGVQRITFVRRRGPDAERREASEEGLLSQQLIRVLIDRTLYLNAEDPCEEDTRIVHLLRNCLRLYESRAARRVIERLSMPELAGVCPVCQHVLCGHPR